MLLKIAAKRGRPLVQTLDRRIPISGIRHPPRVLRQSTVSFGQRSVLQSTQNLVSPGSVTENVRKMAIGNFSKLESFLGTVRISQSALHLFKETENMLYQQGVDPTCHGSVILDSGCGVGEASNALAKQFPNSFVLGIEDTSTIASTGMPSTVLASFQSNRVHLHAANLAFVRAPLYEFWILAAASGWRLKKHLLLHPRPHIHQLDAARRVHAHPAFATMLSLGGEIVCRSVWKQYLVEMGACAAAVLGAQLDGDADWHVGAVRPLRLTSSDISHTDWKYMVFGMPVWELSIACGTWQLPMNISTAVRGLYKRPPSSAALSPAAALVHDTVVSRLAYTSGVHEDLVADAGATAADVRSVRS